MTSTVLLPAADPNVSGLAEKHEETDKRSVARRLTDIALDCFTPGVTPTGDCYMIPRPERNLGLGNMPLTLRGGRLSLRSMLAGAYRRMYGSVASSAALADAMVALEGECQEEDPVPLHLRVARDDGLSWVDLGDKSGEAIGIGPGGWAITTPPVLFRRSEITAAFPRPVEGVGLSGLDKLWRYLNCSESDRPLVLSTIAAALLYPDISHPIVVLTGEYGVGKSTFAVALRRLIDPVPGGPDDLDGPPRDQEGWRSLAGASWVVTIDNLPVRLPEWTQDTLSRAVTGGAVTKRKLYTDDGMTRINYRRQVILTGIGLEELKPDLMSRLLGIDLEPLTGRRVRESVLEEQWQKDWPIIFGAILDLCSEVERMLPDIELDDPPRLADFAYVVAAVDKVMGTSGLETYQEKLAKSSATVADDDPFIAELKLLVKLRALGGKGDFVGTAKDVLELINRKANPNNDPKWRHPSGRTWPKTPVSVTNKLKLFAGALRSDGWAVDNDGGHNKAGVVRWTFRAPSGDEV